MTGFILGTYFTLLILLCFYGCHRLYITHLFRKHATKVPRPEQEFEDLPVMTVQLPVFNEAFVIERLIDATMAIRYPKDKLQVQVLDDSTDETRKLAEAKVAWYRERGYDIAYHHRTNRVGYKAGALEEGLKQARGAFVAIFDADFIPDPEILMATVHYFTDEKVGMVQARWDHLNRRYSMLTQVQAIMLDAHFLIEHGGRCYSDLYFNFNGTAGVWRKAAIEDAGGWQHDTLTEDLDLSYRAQMKGWRFIFMPDITCPAELPTGVTAFKSQQHRWAKGSTQVMLKLLPTIWRAAIPLKVKVEATFHLTGNLAYLLMVINSMFFVIPSMMLRKDHSWWQILGLDGPLFLLASVSFIHFYMSSQYAVFSSLKGRKRFIPALMAVGIGLGINNARAVLEALLGKQSEFVRTPKTGIGTQFNRSEERLRQKGLYARMPKIGWGVLETMMGMLYTVGIVWAVKDMVWGSLPFLLLFQNGFYFIGISTLYEEWSRRAAVPRTQKAAS